MSTKGGAYLLTRAKSINYTHKTVKHNTLSFSTVGYIYNNITKKAFAVQYVLDIFSNNN